MFLRDSQLVKWFDCDRGSSQGFISLFPSILYIIIYSCVVVVIITRARSMSTLIASISKLTFIIWTSFSRLIFIINANITYS